MTVPYERTNAVNRVREFLYDLMDSRVTPKVPKHIRDKAACDSLWFSDCKPSGSIETTAEIPSSLM